MTQTIYSIFDDKAIVYSRPFFLQSIGVALRTFSDMVSDRESGIYYHPSDYKLYKLGTFEDTTGLITALAVPEFIACASEFSQKLQTNNINQNTNQNQNLNSNNLDKSLSEKD